MNLKKILIWAIRLSFLTFLYFTVWVLGSMVIGDLLPDILSEPGLLNEGIAMVLLCLINTILIIGLIVTSRWNGWRLAIFLAVAYYGAFTFLTQIETWYFLSDLTVSSELLLRLFIMGLPIPVIYIPIAIVICRKWNKKDVEPKNLTISMPINQFVLKLGIIAFIYLVIYWLAGYYIAWQNPELRAFYGSPGAIEPFLSHTNATIRKTPSLILLQLIRGVLFTLIAIPIISGSKIKPWLTGLLVGLLFAIPHLVHILPNPLMPMASVRLSHMIETATSSFVFGLIVVWLLHRSHSSIKDLVSKVSI